MEKIQDILNENNKNIYSWVKLFYLCYHVGIQRKDKGTKFYYSDNEPKYVYRASFMNDTDV